MLSKETSLKSSVTLFSRKSLVSRDMLALNSNDIKFVVSKWVINIINMLQNISFWD